MLFTNVMLPLTGGVSSSRTLGDDAIVVCMAANPEPQDPIGSIYSQGAIVGTHPD